MKNATTAILALLLCAAAGCGGDDDMGGEAGAGGSSGGGGAGSGTSGGAGASAGAGGNAGLAGSAGRGGAMGTAGTAGGGAGRGGSGAGTGGRGAGTGGSAGSTGGSSSGVATSTRLDGLSASDKQKLCAWGATLPGIGVEMPCPDGSTVVAEVLTGQECIQALAAATDCAATAGQFEACIHAQLDDACEFFLPECDPIFACAM